MRSLRQQLKELQEFKDDTIAGVYATRSPLGPGALSGALIKGKTITANLVDISELAAVSANTGTLSVTGALIAGSGVNTMGYDPSNGLYMGSATPGSAPFRVTTAGVAAMTGATVSGGITATTLTANGTGSIAGWTIDSAKLSQGNTGIGASGVYRMWSGNLASPSLANFSVDSSGSIKSAGGTIGGMAVSSADMSIAGVGGIGSNGGYNLWTGSSTPSAAPFRVTTAGAMTSTSGSFSGSLSGATGSFTGSVTTSSLDANGGTLGALTVDGVLTIGSGGKIVDADGSYWDSTGIVLKSSGSFGDTIKWQYAGVDTGSLYANSAEFLMIFKTLSNGFVSLGSASASIGVGGAPGIVMDATGVAFTGNSSPGYSLYDTNEDLQLYRRLYPGNAGRQTTGYIAWDGTSLQAAGADWYVTNYLKLAQYGTTGSGALPSPTKWFAVKDSAGVTRYIPAFSAPNSWAA